jgi:beta-phosphoglucomutase-like phosphatase (HAD superfamily)
MTNDDTITDLLKNADALIADFDGTLTDTTESRHQSLRAALAHHGVTLDAI